MLIRIWQPGTLMLTLAVMATLLSAACGGGDPEELEIPVKVEHEKLFPETIKVKQHDMVTLKVEAEEPGELHLHGYDIQMDVAPGEVADLFFEADATGRFKITFHRLEAGEGDHVEEEEGEHEEEEEEVQIGVLEVGPR